MEGTKHRDLEWAKISIMEKRLLSQYDIPLGLILESEVSSWREEKASAHLHGD